MRIKRTIRRVRSRVLQCCITQESYVRQDAIPAAMVFIDAREYHSLQSVVQSPSQPVSLRVVSSREVGNGAGKSKQFLEEFEIKAVPQSIMTIVGHCVAQKYWMEIKAGDLCSFNRVTARVSAHRVM